MSSTTTEQQNIVIAAVEDAAKVSAGKIDLENIGLSEARKLMSAEHQALGYRPPPGSLAAEAQKAAAKHPEASLNVDPAELRQAAQNDAARIEAERGEQVSKKAAFGSLNLNDIDQEAAAKLMSLEHKALGYRPPPGSLAAEAQHAASIHPTTKASIPEDSLSQAALRDAARIASERANSGSEKSSNASEVDLSKVSAEAAQKIQSIEQQFLGETKGTLAAEVQSVQATTGISGAASV